MRSVIIPHVPFGEEAEKMLNNCIKSLNDYDEMVLVVNDGIGYGASFNRGLKIARGDYLVCVSNDTVLREGSISKLCDPDAVTFSENSQFGCFFCLPRWVYEKVGGFDEGYGFAYYEDDDYLLRLEDAKVSYKRVRGVLVDHIGGATVKALGKEQEAITHSEKIHKERWGDRRAFIPQL